MPTVLIEFAFIKYVLNITNFFEIVQKNKDNLSIIQIPGLQKLMCKYSHVLSNDAELTNFVQYDIKLISDKPTRVRPYRFSLMQNEILK